MTTKLRYLICGPRDLTIVGDVWTELSKRTGCLDDNKPELIMHGGCRGVDTTAADWARSWGIDILEFPANWSTDGRAAGPIRNQRMLIEGKPDRVIAFQYKGRETRGTADMIRRARKAGVPVEIVEV